MLLRVLNPLSIPRVQLKPGKVQAVLQYLLHGLEDLLHPNRVLVVLFPKGVLFIGLLFLLLPLTLRVRALLASRRLRVIKRRRSPVVRTLPRKVRDKPEPTGHWQRAPTGVEQAAPDGVSAPRDAIVNVSVYTGT
jgi:hypothetical protein